VVKGFAFLSSPYYFSISVKVKIAKPYLLNPLMWGLQKVEFNRANFRNGDVNGKKEKLF
jgi:hypothetical protein